MERPRRRWWLRLSFLYGRPVAELQRSMSPADVAELMAYDELYGIPWPDAQHREIQSLMCNVHGAKIRGRAATPDDFERKPRTALTEEQIRAGMGRLHAKR